MEMRARDVADAHMGSCWVRGIGRTFFNPKNINTSVLISNFIFGYDSV